MKTLSLLFISLFFLISQSMAQHIITDSMNLGEDRSSHSYQEFGNTISIGNYFCNGDSAITLGGNSQYDSIVFYMDVTPNTDEIVVSWNYSWFNAGSNKDEFTQIVIEDIFEDTLYSPGPNAIGSHSTSCNLDSHRLVFSGMSAHTADGSVKVKIYDPYPAFSGNASICKFIIYSDTVISNNINNQSISDNIKVFPNPFTNKFAIQSTGNFTEDVSVQLYDILGKEYQINFIKNNNKFIINGEKLMKGIYFIKIKDNDSGEIIWSQKLVKQ